MDGVFSVPELAEAIFLHLDMNTLIVSASRVSKAWNGLIAQSGPIQKALFFQPNIQNPDHESSSPRINPLLAKRFGHCFFDTGVLDGRSLELSSFYAMPWTFDKRQSQLLHPGPEAGAPSEPKLSDITPLEFRQIRQAGRKIRRKEASWRRMLVSQPPPPHLGFLFSNSRYDGSFIDNIETSIMRPESQQQPFTGVRMGMLYDLVQDRLAQYEHCRVLFRVVWRQTLGPYLSHMCDPEDCRLLEHTSLVVEVSAPWLDEDEEPQDVTNFDKHFRSRAYVPLQVSESERNSKQDVYLMT